MLLLALLAACGGMLVTAGLFRHRASTAGLLEDREIVETEGVQSRFLRLAQRIAPLLRGIGGGRSLARATRMLGWSGWHIDPEVWLALKAMAATGGAALGLLGGAAAGGVSFAPVLAILLGMVAWTIPDTLLDRRVRAVRAAMGREAIIFGDFLVASLAAGLPLERAMEYIGSEIGGLFAPRIARIAAEAQITKSDIDLDMRAFAADLNDPQATALITSILQAKASGGDLTRPLVGLLGAMSATRLQKLRTAARGRASTQFVPLMFVIFPGILLPIGFLVLRSFQGAGFGF